MRGRRLIVLKERFQRGEHSLGTDQTSQKSDALCEEGERWQGQIYSPQA